jgi:hypothetical protein
MALIPRNTNVTQVTQGSLHRLGFLEDSFMRVDVRVGS